MVALMSMVSVNAVAQRSGRGHEGRELVMHSNGRMEMRGDDRGYGVAADRGRHEGRMDMGMRGSRHDNGIRRGMERHVDRHGWYPGYEGRVRYIDGRWGYWRDNSWYYYDCFYEPAYYYARPVGHFHAHLSPVGRKIVGGVVGTVAVASLISALVH